MTVLTVPKSTPTTAEKIAVSRTQKQAVVGCLLTYHSFLRWFAAFSADGGSIILLRGERIFAIEIQVCEMNARLE